MDKQSKNLKLDDDLVKEIESLKDSQGTIKKKKRIWIPVTVAASVVLIGAIAFYIIKSNIYKNIFLPNTFVNSIDVSGKTAPEVNELIKNQCKEYSAEITFLGRDPELIYAKDIDLHFLAGDDIDNALKNQNIWSWPLSLSSKTEISISTVTKLDDNKLNEVCNNLKAFDDSTAVKPTDAKLGDYDDKSNSYLIIPENNGNIVTDKVKAVDFIKNSVLVLEPKINLENEDIYSEANIKSNNTDLLAKKNELDAFVKPKINYQGHDIVLDGRTLHSWIIRNDDGTLTYDENKIRNFVSMVASTYNTLGKDRKLVTQYGNETIVNGGDFGWEVNQEAEFEELKTILDERSITNREPVYISRGISYGDNDWGDTYVEINLAKQHVFFVKEGRLIVSSDCVTGGLQRRTPTPTGVYSVKYKARNAVLRGPRRGDGSYAWESPVSYWMPFNNGIGLHDAKWRGSFGGKIYQTNGSHGCVNLPLKKASVIFEEISPGIPVIVYDDDFEIINYPLDPEEEAKLQAAEEKELQKKIEAEAKKAVKVTNTNNETIPETSAPVVSEPQIVSEPESIETLPEETTQQETVPIEWGPGYDRGTDPSEPEGPGVQIYTVESYITENVENLPEGM